MNNSTDSTQPPPSDSKQQVIVGLKPEIDQWQARIDAAKLQMHLGTKEARAKLRPHVERLEQDLGRVNIAWVQLEASSDDAWKDIYHGLKLLLLAIRRSFAKAEQYFENPDDN